MNSAIHEPKPATPISTALAPRSAGLNAASWALALVAAGILGMTLPFKYTGAEETVRLFETLGAGTPGRLGTALLETLAVGLLLVPRTRALGGTLTAGLMAGALLGHAFVLGILWDGDATLFSMAVTAFLAGAGVAWIHRRELPIVGALFGGRTGSLRRVHCAGFTAPGSLRRVHCAGFTALGSLRWVHRAGFTALGSLSRAA